MNPATKATVEFAVDLLLQSVYDENTNALDSMRRISSQPGDAEINTGMLSRVDNYAGAIKSTLDDVQGRLLDKISALHTEHNRMIPLHKLPIEIFVQVITVALESFQTRQWSRPTHLGRLVTLCQVCKRWKDVINRTASLWATIDIRDPAVIISTAISRSANHPLNIIGAPSLGPIRAWCNAPDGWEEFTNTAISHSTRWRSVQLAVASPEAVLAIMGADVPRLESLEVKSTSECQFDSQEGGSLFQAIGPQLRRLGLHGLAIQWDSCVLRNLRHLSISGLDNFVPSCEEMLGMLRECPGLVDVVLLFNRTADVENSRQGPSFTLAQLDSMSLSRLSPSWALALLETIRTPSVRSVNFDLDFSDSGHLFPSVVKRVCALCSIVNDTRYHLEINLYGSCLHWTCYPINSRGWRHFGIKVWNNPVSETLETLWSEAGTNRFTPESVLICLGRSVDLEMSLFLPKLDGIHTINSFLFFGGDADPLFTYMSNPTTSSEWGLPKLEKLTIYDCDYDPERLLEMVLARYGGEGSEGDNNSDDGRDRPPPFQELTIGHAPGEADIETLDLVEDIVGEDCFTLEEDVER